ncbi:MAG: cell division protein FtsZ [Rhodothermales bacterium]
MESLMDEFYSPTFTFDDDGADEAKIGVVGVGGGGGNAVNNMIRRGIQGVEFIAVNTDSQDLKRNEAPYKIQAGRTLTRGLGAGARPNVGMDATRESIDEIKDALSDFDMVFITAGMGGGTGTGGAPIVAEVAQELGILTVAVVTTPFEAEGRKRNRFADQGIELLRRHVDTLIVIPNERLLSMAADDTTLIEAFQMADNVLYEATRGISDLITETGVINLDFNDVKTTMKQGGKALMGSATANGSNRGENAAIAAISDPLLGGVSIAGARNVLVNITASESLGIKEALAATRQVQQEAGDDVEVIFGTVVDANMGDNLRVTVIATGFEKIEEPEVLMPEPKPVAAPIPVAESQPIEEATQAVEPAVAEVEVESEVVETPEEPIVMAEPMPEPPRRQSIRITRPRRGQYKGEQALRELDTPTYERDQVEPDVPEPKMKNKVVHRLRSDERKERTDRNGRSKDSDTPSFLKEMLD